MEEQFESSAAGRVVEQQVERRGLRPRVAAAVIAILWLIAIVVFGVIERLVNPETFDSAWDGMWWATQTVTTVGYGDVVPQSTDGKVIAAVLMIGGLSFFAVITGVITSAFVTAAQARRRASGEDPLAGRIEKLGAEVAALREELSQTARPPPDG